MAPRGITLAAPFSFHASSLRTTSAAPFLYTAMHTGSPAGSRTFRSPAHAGRLLRQRRLLTSWAASQFAYCL